MEDGKPQTSPVKSMGKMILVHVEKKITWAFGVPILNSKTDPDPKHLSRVDFVAFMHNALL